MKNYFLIYVLWVIASVVAAPGISRTKFEKGIRRLFEESRGRGGTRYLAIAVPSLNPLKLPPITINRDYTLSLSGLTVTGLENMTVKKLSTSLNKLSMSIEIFVPSLVARADHYHLEAARIFSIPLVNNKGKFRCVINKLVGSGTVKFGSSGGNTVITSLHIKYSIHDVQVQLSGSSALVNRKATSKMWDLMQEKRLASKIERFVRERATRYLRGHTPKQFIQIISTL